jgi:uncharacterized membrane protein YcaP (DUF421 family)
VLRSLSLITFLFFLTKWLRTKHLSQLNLFESFSAIILGGIAAIHTVNPNTNFSYAVIAMAVWFIVPFGV